jgi:hypothetical protein
VQEHRVDATIALRSANPPTRFQAAPQRPVTPYDGKASDARGLEGHVDPNLVEVTARR